MIDNNNDKPNHSALSKVNGNQVQWRKDEFPETLSTDWKKVGWFCLIGLSIGLGFVFGVIKLIYWFK